MSEGTYPTTIGPLALTTNWPALELAIQHRCGYVAPGPKPISLTVHLLPAAEVEQWEREGWFPVADARVVALPDSINAVIPEASYFLGPLIDWLWMSLAHYCRPEGWEFLHAAAVTEGDGVTLIIGPSGAGKTTTLFAFLDAGAQLLADDAMLLEGETVHPWCADLHLSPEQLERWPHLVGNTLDSAGKVRICPQALGYPASDGGMLKRVIILAEAGEPLGLHHPNLIPTGTMPDDLGVFGAAPVEFWGPRPAGMAERIAAEHRPDCPSFACITLFAGKAWCLGRWVESFVALNLPAHAHLLWLYNGEDPDYWQQLSNAAALLRLTYPNLQLWRDPHHYGLKDRQVAELYRQARTRVPEGCEFVFALEDDVLPEASAFWDMLGEWARRGGRDIVGVPVGHVYQHGEVTALAWEYERTERGVQIAPGVAVREARPQGKPAEVGGISFSCTLIPAKLLHAATLAPGNDNFPAGGYDHQFSREATAAGAKVVALWGVEAIHLKEEYPGTEVRLRKRRLLVLGDGEHVPDGPTWEVVGREPADHLSDRIEVRECDYALLTSADARLSPAYLDALIEHLAWNPQFGAVWGYQEGADGGMTWGSGAGCLLRRRACRGAKADTLEALRKWFAAEGWREGHTDRAHYHRLTEAESYLPARDPRREASPYRVLMTNRDQWGGLQPGFGGDMTQIHGYRQGLRNLGIYADLRGPDFADFAGYHLIHLHHVQFEWAWQAAEHDFGGGPVLLSTITHKLPERDLPKWYIERAVNPAQHLICYSRQEAAFYADLFPEKRIHVVPMGVDARLFAPRPPVEQGDPSVFMAGKLCDYKNQLSVLKACKLLDLPVAFAGFNEDPVEDPYVAEFMAAVERYPKARYVGFLHGADLWAEYDRAHVHVNASRFEPFGQVTLDALACGCNIVHTQHSWAAEQFGAVGSPCDPDDIESIAEAIAREVKRRRGWHGLRPPTWTEAARALLAVYEEAMN